MALQRWNKHQKWTSKKRFKRSATLWLKLWLSSYLRDATQGRYLLLCLLGVKSHEAAGFTRLPRKRKFSKGNYLPEIRSLIKRNFQSTIRHEQWFIDIIQKIYLSDTFYLAMINDAGTRCVVGHATCRRHNSELVVLALTKAVESHHPVRTINHSDNGSLFKSEHYGKATLPVGITDG